MKAKGPVLTLVGGLVLAAALLGLSIVANRTAEAGQRDTAGQRESAGQSAPAATATTGSPNSVAAAPATQGTSVDPPKSAPVTYAGRVDGGGVAIAIAVRDGEAVSYVCNGKKLETWFQGPAGDGQLALAGASGAAILGTYDNGKATGSITVAGRKFTFGIPVVQAPAGLYKIADTVANASIQGGWVVDEYGQTGSLTINGETDSAPPLNLTTGEVVINGVAVKPGRL